jgi:hypothetical protein
VWPASRGGRGDHAQLSPWCPARRLNVDCPWPRPVVTMPARHTRRPPQKGETHAVKLRQGRPQARPGDAGASQSIQRRSAAGFSINFHRNGNFRPPDGRRRKMPLGTRRVSSPLTMSSNRPSRKTLRVASVISKPSGFDGHDALTWPFPETQCSPVWQAWREAQEASREELRGSARLALGLRQVIRDGAIVRRSDDAQERSRIGLPEECLVDGALEAVVSSAPSKEQGRLGESLDRHFGPELAARLRRAALETLGDVATADTSGRRWWAIAPGIGPRRAREIADRVHSLLGLTA